MRSKEEKLSIIKQVLQGASVSQWENQGLHHSVVQAWVKIYQAEGEAGLEVKKKPGNPLSRYERRKELTYEEQLQYQIELLKRELVKKEAEVLRLKKLNERKGGDARKR
jgi:transposase-like protein